MERKLTGVICIDGANATGKTTLAEELKKRHDAVILHQTYRFTRNIFAYHAAVLRRALELAKTRLVILDRLWMSEVIYAQIYRNGTPWPHQGRMVDRVLLKACAVQIVSVERDREVLIERYRKTRANRTDVDAVRNADVNDLYLKTLGRNPNFDNPPPEVPRKTYLDDMAELANRRSRQDVIEHTIRPNGTELTCDLVEKRLVELQSTQLLGALDNDNFLGMIRPRTSILITGDAPKPKHRWTWPFFEYAHSSLWLTEQLHRILFDETVAIWTNVNDREHDTLAQLMVEQGPLMGKIQVVALGQSAADRVKSFGLKPAIVPHPQWGRRFAADGKLYRDALRNAIAQFHPTFLAPDPHSP